MLFLNNISYMVSEKLKHIPMYQGVVSLNTNED